MADIAINAFIKDDGSVVKIICEIYSLPINATPESDAAFEIRMMQLMAKAMEG
jgi:hypothetical protein